MGILFRHHRRLVAGGGTPPSPINYGEGARGNARRYTTFRFAGNRYFGDKP